MVFEVFREVLEVNMPAKNDRPIDPARPGKPAGAASQPGLVTERRRPLITAMEIENFKGIGRPVRIDLRPITLLFGRNSAGKSTILHALCYAHELLSPGRVDAGRTELGGAHIDLGGFRRFVHAHDRDRKIRLRFELNLEDWTVPARLWEKMKRPNIEPHLVDEYGEWIETHDPAMSARSGWVELAITWERLYEQPVLASYEVGVNDSLVGRILWTDSFEGANLEFDWTHVLFDPLRHRPLGGDRAAGSHFPAGHVRERVDPSADGWRLHHVGLYGLARLPDWNELLGFNVEDLAADREHGIESPASANLPRFRALVSGVFIGIGDTLRNELAGLRYIGPVRRLHPRVTIEPGSADRGKWSDGSAAWNLLLHADRGLIYDMNDWLESADRLDTGYKLRRRSMIELPADEDPIRRIRFLDRLPGEYRNEDGDVDPEHWVRKQAAEIAEHLGCDPDQVEVRIKMRSLDGVESAGSLDQDDPDTAEIIDSNRETYGFLTDCVAAVENLEKGGSAVRTLVRAIATAQPHPTLDLVTVGTELPVRTSDIGVGISQILPVVAAALDPHRPGITAIEQPELHLHPAMQVEFGDLFAQPVDNGRVFLLENHSEHLMLRLLRRIEETHSGELPEGKPALRPDQVSVVFLEQVDGETQATRLRIDETGEFIDRWPHGFFDERDDELF